MPSGSGGSLSLLFRIEADDKGAQSELKALEKQLTDTSGASNKLAPDIENLSKKVLGLSGAGGETTSALSSMAGAMGSAGVVALGMAAAIAAAMAALAACVHEAVSLGSELHDLSQTTGIAVENLAALKVAAVTSGSSLEELSQAFVRFERAASDGGAKAEAALTRFGLTAAEVADNPQAAFDQFLKKFNEVGPSAQRTADLMALFGRGGARLIPTFTELSGGLEEARKRAEELGISFSSDLANKADDLGDKIDIIKLQMQAFAVNVGSELMPALSSLANIFISLMGVIQPLAHEIGFMADAMLAGIAPLSHYREGWELLESVWLAIRGITPTLPKIPDVEKVPENAGTSWYRLGQYIHDSDTFLKSFKETAHGVPDIKAPAVDEASLAKQVKEMAGAAGKAGEIFDQITRQQREKQLQDEIRAGAGLGKVAKERKRKEAEIETGEAQAQAKARFDVETRLENELQQALKADLDQKLLNQDQFTDAMIASEKRLAESRIQQAKDLAAQDSRHAKSPDDRAAIATRLDNEIKNIESASLIRQRAMDNERVTSNAAAADKIDKENERLAEKEKKRAEDVHDFWFRQAIAIQEAIDKIDPEKVKPPQFVTQAVGIIADVHSTVTALDDQTRAWNETKFAAKEYFDAIQKGTASIADANAQLDAMIQKLVDQSFQLLQAGKTWQALGLFITKALPLAFLSAFNQQLHKMVDAYIQTGHTGRAALKQLVAGTLEALGQMASAWAAYAFGMAIISLAMHQYHDAALYFAGGLGLEVLALALGFAASKVRPDQGGGGASSSAAQVIQPPNTTINLGPGVVGAQLGGSPGELFGAVIESNNRQSQAIERLWGTIAMSSPGDVVTRAAATTPTAFATGVTNAQQKSASFNRSMGLTLSPA